jgi:hypothetical protein
MRTILLIAMMFGPLFGMPPLTAMPSYYKASVAMSRLDSEQLFAAYAKMTWMSNDEFELTEPDLRANNGQTPVPRNVRRFRFQANNARPVSVVSRAVVHPRPPKLALPDKLKNHPAFKDKRVELISQGNDLLILAETSQPSAKLEMGSGRDMDGDTRRVPKQAWLADANGDNLKPLFFSRFDYGYVWTPKANYIVVFGYCYGVHLGSGLYIIDVRRERIRTLLKEYAGHCEGGIGFSTSPDDEYIVFQGQSYAQVVVASLDGKKQMQTCENNEFVRTYAWTEDGQYLYLSCGLRGQDGSDSLRRLDTKTGQRKLLVDRTKVSFKAIRLAVSPDQKRVAFEWGSSNFVNMERFGYWIIDLQLAAF